MAVTSVLAYYSMATIAAIRGLIILCSRVRFTKVLAIKSWKGSFIYKQLTWNVTITSMVRTPYPKNVCIKIVTNCLRLVLTQPCVGCLIVTVITLFSNLSFMLKHPIKFLIIIFCKMWISLQLDEKIIRLILISVKGKFKPVGIRKKLERGALPSNS